MEGVLETLTYAVSVERPGPKLEWSGFKRIGAEGV